MHIGSGMVIASDTAMDVSMMMLIIKINFASVQLPTTILAVHATPICFLIFPTYYSLHMSKLVSWYQIDWKR